MTWPDAMIGLPTGETNRIFVLDIDRHGVDGFESLTKLENQYGKLPATLTVATPSGGQHRYFKYPADREIRNSSSKIAPGLDIRGKGGYVVCPPSVTAEGKKYRVRHNRPVVDAPPWLLDLIAPLEQTEQKDRLDGTGLKQALKKSIHPYLKSAVDDELAKVVNAETGTRNTTLNDASFSLGQWVGGGELDEDEARAMLKKAGGTCGLEADEVERTVESGLAAGMDNPRTVPEAKNEKRPERKKSKSPFPLKFSTLKEIAEWPNPTWRIEGLIPEQGFGIVYGPSGSGKSFLGMDLAITLARGDKEWFGFPIVEPCGCLYVYLESPSGLPLRTKAWKNRHRCELPENVSVATGSFDLLDDDQVDELIKNAPPKGLIILDTLAVACPGIDENSSKDMGLAIDAARKIHQETQGFCLLVHHTGKAESSGPRGSSALPAAIDLTMRVSKNDTEDMHRLVVEKVRDGESGITKAFKLPKHFAGENAKGEEQFSCCVQFVESEGNAKSVHLTDGENFALKTLKEEIEVSGNDDIHLDDWRTRYNRESVLDNGKSKNTTFKRAREKLKMKGYIKASNDYYSIIER